MVILKIALDTLLSIYLRIAPCHRATIQASCLWKGQRCLRHTAKHILSHLYRGPKTTWGLGFHGIHHNHNLNLTLKSLCPWPAPHIQLGVCGSVACPAGC